MRFSGAARLGILALIVIVLIVVAYHELEVKLKGNIHNIISKVSVFGKQEIPAAKAKVVRNKCNLSVLCASGHLAFRLLSGAASIVGPKICLEDDILMSSVKNNVGRGFNIALVEGSTGMVKDTKVIDMWGGDVKDLITFLKDIPKGMLVFIATFDDGATKLNDEARELIQQLGSKAIKSLAFRDSWVFVGAKGIDSSLFEKHMKNNKETNKYEGWPELVEIEGCIPTTKV
uniref:Family with sequence similarity 3 member C n=1 Tax=Eptatretus burgeri TaxID=7764 RepID=A0A8C4QG20_EPTBU